MSVSDPSTMSTADKKPDWLTAEIRYVRGDNRPDIVRECHLPSLSALDKRARRKGWTRHRRVIVEHKKTVTIIAAKQPDDAARPKIQARLVDLIDSPHLSKPASSLAQLKEQMSVLHMGAQTGKVAYGWAEENNRQIMTEELIRSLTPDLVTPPTAIDVPTVAPNEPISAPEPITCSPDTPPLEQAPSQAESTSPSVPSTSSPDSPPNEASPTQPDR